MKIILACIENHRKITGEIFPDEWLINKTADLPLGLASIKAFSRSDSFIKKTCKFFNRIYIDDLPDDSIAQDILSIDPDLIGFSIHLWNFRKIIKICHLIKNKNPKIKVVLGGPLVPDDTASNFKILSSNPWIDILIRGEGEIPFRQLLKNYLKKEFYSEIPNTALRQGNKIYVSKKRILIKDLSELPSPYINGDVAIYKNATGLLPIETSRGCIYDCFYCRAHDRGGLRYIDLKRIEHEFKFLNDINFKGNVFITDPLLNFNKNHTKKVLRMMAGLNCKKICLDIKPEFITDEIISLFKKIPALDLSVGIQSINPIALKNVNRPANIQKSREVLLKLAKEKIGVGTDLIVGLPGDNFETFKRTIDWAVYCGVEKVDINTLVLIPNSPLEKLVRKFKIKYDINNYNFVLSTKTFNTKDMEKAAHFTIAFEFLFGFHKKIFKILTYKFGFKPSEIIKKFIIAAKETREILPGQFQESGKVNFSNKTIFSFIKNVVNDTNTRRLLLRLFIKNIALLKNNENYKIKFGENKNIDTAF